jgi:integrase
MEASEQNRLKAILKRNGNLPKRRMTLLKDSLKYLEGFQSSRTWLNRIKSNLTKKKYAKALFRYCAGVGLNPDELLRLKPTVPEITAQMFSAIQDGKKPDEITINEYEAEQTLENYLAEANFKNKLGIKSAVISFYKANKRDLNSDVAPTVTQRDKAPQEYQLPTVDDIAAMANATTNPRDEFLIWFLQSTGMRRGTVPQLQFKDLKMIVSNGETKIEPFNPSLASQLDSIAPILLQIGSDRLKGRYKGVQQIAFLHFKAYQTLMSYWKWLRQQKRINVTWGSPLFVNFNNPEQPLGHNGIHRAIVEACIAAFGEDKKPYSPHDLRRFHQTSLEKARLPANWVKKLQAKKLAGEQSPYSLPNILDLHQAFKDAINYFVPTTEPQPQEHLAKRITQQDALIQKQSQIIDQQAKTLEDHDTKMQKILSLQQNTMQTLQQAFKDLEAYKKRIDQQKQN